MVMLPTLFTLLQHVCELMDFKSARLTLSAQDMLPVITVIIITVLVTCFLRPPFLLLLLVPQQTAIFHRSTRGSVWQTPNNTPLFSTLGCPTPVA